MPKYRLSIEKNNEFIEIDWSSLLVPGSEKIITDLLNIDKLTTKFSNSDELKGFLYAKNIINSTQGKLCITYKNKGIDKKLLYGISYFEDKQFLKRSYLITYIWEKIEELDVNFFNRMINKYKTNPIHSNDIVVMRNFIESINANQINEIKITYMKDKMTNFVNKETLKYDFNNKRYEIDSNNNPILTYKNLRELGRLCSNYYHNMECKKEEIEEKPDNKIMKLDKKQIPGQLSLFD